MGGKQKEYAIILSGHILNSLKLSWQLSYLKEFRRRDVDGADRTHISAVYLSVSTLPINL
jgi:hypothetical protein